MILSDTGLSDIFFGSVSLGKRNKGKNKQKFYSNLELKDSAPFADYVPL